MSAVQVTKSKKRTVADLENVAQSEQATLAKRNKIQPESYQRTVDALKEKIQGQQILIAAMDETIARTLEEKAEKTAEKRASEKQMAVDENIREVVTKILGDNNDRMRNEVEELERENEELKQKVEEYTDDDETARMERENYAMLQENIQMDQEAEQQNEEIAEMEEDLEQLKEVNNAIEMDTRHEMLLTQELGEQNEFLREEVDVRRMQQQRHNLMVMGRVFEMHVQQRLPNGFRQ